MKLYLYADESGTFDKEHNDLFVYGGLVVPGDSAKRDLERKYSAIENDIRRNASRFGDDDELKACHLRMKERKRLLPFSKRASAFSSALWLTRRGCMITSLRPRVPGSATWTGHSRWASRKASWES